MAMSHVRVLLRSSSSSCCSHASPSSSWHKSLNIQRPKSFVTTSSNTNNTPADAAAIIAHTLHRLEQSQLILCIRESDSDAAYNAASAAIRGGIRAVELTLTTPNALDILLQLHNDYYHDYHGVQLGAGTVMSVDQVDLLAAALDDSERVVKFVMSPVTDAAVVARAHDNGILAIPGAMTPTEIWHAYHTCGANVVKVFPMSACGTAFVQALNGPMGHVKLLPTSSVDRSELGVYLRSDNVLAVGVSRQIVDSDLIANKDWDAIRRNARDWITLAQQQHAPKPKPKPPPSSSSSLSI